MEKRFEIKVFGSVQGVFFRYSTVEQAKKLEVTGWVANEIDGSVRIVAEGKKEALDKLVEWVKRGPDLANVDKVEVKEKPYKGEFRDFGVR